jgi:hypothetical protein
VVPAGGGTHVAPEDILEDMGGLWVLVAEPNGAVCTGA